MLGNAGSKLKVQPPVFHNILRIGLPSIQDQAGTITTEELVSLHRKIQAQGNNMLKLDANTAHCILSMGKSALDYASRNRGKFVVDRWYCGYGWTTGQFHYSYEHRAKDIVMKYEYLAGAKSSL